MSCVGVRRCKMGLLGPKNPKITFFGRYRPYFRPNRPIYVIPYLADSAGNSAGIGREIYFLDSVDLGDPFCTLGRFHNSFCDDFELYQRSVKILIFMKFGSNSQKSPYTNPLKGLLSGEVMETSISTKQSK